MKNLVISKVLSTVTHVGFKVSGSFGILIVLSVILLTACGGGGNAKGPTPNEAPSPSPSPDPQTNLDAPAPQTYRFFSVLADRVPGGGFDEKRKAVALKAIHPEDPTTVVDVDADGGLSGASWGTPLITFDPGSTQDIWTDMHVSHVLYNKEDGRLYLVSTSTDSVPEPKRFSKEEGAKELCEVDDQLFLEEAIYFIFYELPGKDEDCASRGDNVWRLVKADLKADDFSNISPIDVPRVADQEIHFVKDINGNISWLLVEETENGTMLVKYSFDFVPASRVEMLHMNTLDLLGEMRDGRWILNLDGELVLFDPLRNLLSSSYHSFTDSFELTMDDGEALFFTDWNINGFGIGGPLMNYTLYRFDLKDPEAPKVILDGESGLPPLVAVANRDRIFYVVGRAVSSQEPYRIRVVSKRGGNPVTLVTSGNLNERQFIAGMGGVDGDLIYYNVVIPNPEATTPDGDIKSAAVVMNSKGQTIMEVTNAEWVGTSWRNSMLNFGQGRGFLLDHVQAKHMILAEYRDGKKHLAAYDADTAAIEVELGELPDDVDGFLPITSVNVGNDLILNAYRNLGTEDVPSLAWDVFYMNSGVADSLTRVTDTMTTSEFPIGGNGYNFSTY